MESPKVGTGVGIGLVVHIVHIIHVVEIQNALLRMVLRIATQCCACWFWCDGNRCVCMCTHVLSSLLLLLLLLLWLLLLLVLVLVLLCLLLSLLFVIIIIHYVAYTCVYLYGGREWEVNEGRECSASIMIIIIIICLIVLLEVVNGRCVKGLVHPEVLYYAIVIWVSLYIVLYSIVL